MASFAKYLRYLFLVLAILSVTFTAVRGEASDEYGEDATQPECDGVAIGIDLGTTFSCVAIYNEGEVQIIPNELGDRTTPSRVRYLSKREHVVGSLADLEIATHPASVIYDSKRLIGRDFSDKAVQSDIKRWAFGVKEVKGQAGGKLYINVTPSKDGEKPFSITPEEVSSAILKKLKDDAESYLKKKVCTAVITVPAYFNDAQRKLTRDAAALAGLNVSRIVSEPTAAAIAYGLNTEESGRASKNPKILVYDLGGGTFDVSVLDLEDGMFEVRATGGNTHLGGQDFDRNLVDSALASWIKNQGKGIKASDISPKSMALIYSEAEKAKRILSSSLETTISVPDFHKGINFNQVVTRANFEYVNRALFEESINVVKRVIKDANTTVDKIDEVVIVGGSTRIPKIQKMLSDLFKKPLRKDINPDEAVAYGASVQAAILAGVKDGVINDYLLLDVASLTLGIEVQGGIMAPIIPRNTHIPTSITQTFTTVADNQPSVIIKVYEGERSMVKDNHELGKFELTGIPPAPRGTPQIDVTFFVNADSILEVTAVEKESGNRRSTVVRNDARRLTQEQIDNMIREAEENAERDAEVKELIASKNSFESSIYNAKTHSKSLESNSNPEVKGAIIIIKSLDDWYNVHKDTCTKEQIAEKSAELEKALSALASALISSGSGNGTHAGFNPTDENFIPPTSENSDFDSSGDL